MTAFLIYYVALSLIHVYACYFEREHVRKMTKPLLLASLAAYYFIAARAFDPLILGALICGMVGDIFLLWPKEKATFLMGACTFALGHALYAVKLFTLASDTGASTGWPLMLIIAVYLAQIIIATLKLAPHIKDSLMTKLMPLYFGMVALINIGAWMYLICSVHSGIATFPAILMVTGGIFFLVSDTILATALFKGNIRRPNFYVMLTYITAQACLCMGFIMV